MVSRVFSINTKCQIPIYRADTLICKPQLNNTHGAVERLLHFSLYGGTHEQIQRNRPDIRPPASPAPQSGDMGADAQNDLQLLEAQFLRGNASYSPEPQSGNVRNHRPVEQYRTVHKARRAFHSSIQKPRGYTAHVPFRCAPDLRKGVQFQVEALRANG